MEQADFIAFLKQQDPQEVDKLVFELNEEIAPGIDCTSCGNCCKSLMINVTADEAKSVADHLAISAEKFEEKFLEKGSSLMVVNTIPCYFLADNKCTIYEHRFAGCREFPALHLPGITKRLFTIFMHYDRCPIISNVMDAVEERLLR